MSGERGEASLVGLLVAGTLFVGVLGATFDMFGTAERLNRKTQEQAEAQALVRAPLDAVARELRNLASPGDRTVVLDRAAPHDVVLRVVDPFGTTGTANVTNTMRVRYCLSDGRLHRMEQRWTTAAVPAAPSATGCPGAGWTGARVLAGGVANQDAGAAVETFAYDAAAPGDVTAVRVTLAVDADPGRGAAATRVSTGVFLRNQNRAPTAVLDAVANPQGGVVLNASASADPEGEPLTFTWADGGTAITGCTAITCTYDPTGTAARRITVTVRDPSGAAATAELVVTA